ncbi:MAG TPA: hypothetical protein VGE74_29525 [Gemmata sp.]
MRWRLLILGTFLLGAAVGCDSKKTEAPKDPVPPPKERPSGAGIGGGSKGANTPQAPGSPQMKP